MPAVVAVAAGSFAVAVADDERIERCEGRSRVFQGSQARDSRELDFLCVSCELGIEGGTWREKKRREEGKRETDGPLAWRRASI